MSALLTNEEKITIIDQHIKSINYSLYGFELELKEAQAISNPDSEVIASINLRISDHVAKISALNEELATLQ
ncbi:MAG: hypothetical protein RLZZ196_76 [Bacteroidota bacterium]|jgi:hypothetical protein